MCIQSVILTVTFFRPFQKVMKIFDFSTSDFGWVPLCVDQISAVHPICYIDLDIFSTFPKGDEKLWFFNFRFCMGATLCGPDLRNFLPFTLDNDFYRQLRCHRCASNLLFWPWHFVDLPKRSRKTFIFQFNTLDGCHFVWTRFQKLFAIYFR